MDLKLVISGFIVFLAGAVLYFVKATESTLIFKLAFIGLIVLGITVTVLGISSEKGEALEEPVIDEPEEPEEPTPELEEPKEEEPSEPEAPPVEAKKEEKKRVVEDKSQIQETEKLIKEVAESIKQKKGKRK